MLHVTLIFMNRAKLELRFFLFLLYNYSEVLVLQSRDLGNKPTAIWSINIWQGGKNT